MARKSDLPFGSEFSPKQVEIERLLELAIEHGGDWHAFEDSIRLLYFEDRPNTSEYNRRKLANNTRLSLIGYGIYDRESSSLTAFGSTLYEVRHNPARLRDLLARHILLNLNGMALVQCILDMRAAGEKITLVSLRRWLGECGLHFPRGGRHPSTMTLWLAEAGVISGPWQVDEERVRELLGLTVDEVDELAVLSPQQRAYLRTLANVAEQRPLLSNELERLATATYGVVYNEKSLAKDVLYPLERAGWIRLERGTREHGRGAKPFLVYGSEKLVVEVIEPLLQQLEAQVAADLRPLLRCSLAQILEELDSPNRHVRGLALEALAFKLMRLVDLTYVATRLRGAATGGAEVDLIFEAARLVFSRWQVQCKNTTSVRLDDVAKEVGLVHMLKSNVIVVVSTGTISSEARSYARKVMADSNLAIVMIDGTDVHAIRDTPTQIVGILNREAREAMTIKRLDL